MNKIFGIIMLLVVISGCIGVKNHSEVDKTIFEKELSLEADSVSMEVIIKPGNIYYAEPYMIISDVESGDKMHFHVFNGHLDYLYSFCEYGDGPEACIMPTVVKNMPSGEFMVRDHATNSYHKYELGDTGATATKTFTIPDLSPYESLCEISKVDSTLFIAKGVAPRKTVRRIIDFSTLKSIDSIPQTFDLEKSMGKDYYTELDDCWMAVTHNGFACAYFFIDRVEFGTMTNGRMKIVNYCGAENAPDFYIYTDEKLNGKYEYNVDYNIVYYEWLATTGDMVYASYFGLPWGEIKQHSSIIESYTADGTPKTLYHLDIPLASFAVCGNRIIGINPERSDDMIYVYNLDEE